MVWPHLKISGMAKTVLQGTKKGARRRGRQKKRWEDNYKEWTGIEFGDSLRAAEDGKWWKGIVATSSVVSSGRINGYNQYINDYEPVFSLNGVMFKIFSPYE